VTTESVGGITSLSGEAALQTLDQLEWCVNYLYRVRKPNIARAIARNRKQILGRLP
jgi:hypothetical protein